MHLDLIGAVFQRVFFGNGFPRELAGFANESKLDPELVGDRRPEDEPADSMATTVVAPCFIQNSASLSTQNLNASMFCKIVVISKNNIPAFGKFGTVLTIFFKSTLFSSRCLIPALELNRQFIESFESRIEKLFDSMAQMYRRQIVIWRFCVLFPNLTLFF